MLFKRGISIKKIVDKIIRKVNKNFYRLIFDIKIKSNYILVL